MESQVDEPNNSEGGALPQGTLVTGLKIAYYNVCLTKLWLFSHQIQFENENVYVQMGRQIQEKRYNREKKDILINDMICIDYIQKKENGERKVLIHEIKKSDAMENSHRWQIKYYIFYLNKLGVKADGVINYPTINKKVEISFAPEDSLEIEKMLEQIHTVIIGKMPAPERKKICMKCAYYEFCFGD